MTDIKKEDNPHEEETAAEPTNTKEPAKTPKKKKARITASPKDNLVSHLPYSAAIGDIKVGLSATLCLPTRSYKSFENLIEQQNSLKMANTPSNNVWASAVTETASFYHKDNLFDSAFDRPGSEWTQSPSYEDKPIVVARPKIGTGSGDKASGESAMLRVRSLAGLGTVSNVPLYATGIWVRMKAPTDDALLTLDGLIANEKYVIGRITYGQAFSHNSVYITKHLVNFILDHVYDSSLVDSSTDKLRDVISELDYPTLIHGLLCTIYPNGYDLAQPCIASIGECTFVARAKVSMSKLLWVDHKRMTTWQLKYMAQRNKKVTDEDLIAYKKASTDNLNKTSVTLNGSLVFNFAAPSLSNSIDTGQQWIDGIVNTVDDAMRLNSEERNLFLIKRAQAQILCTYAGWVSNIEEIDEEGETVKVIDDTETILATLENLSESSDISDLVLNGIAEFINDATISIVGVPDFDCPECQNSQLGEDEGYTGIIPLNPENVFFSLTRQRIDQMLTTRKI